MALKKTLCFAAIGPKYAPFSDFFLKKRGAAQQILKNANPTLSQNIFHLSGGFAFWNFQEKRNGILAIFGPKT